MGWTGAAVAVAAVAGSAYAASQTPDMPAPPSITPPAPMPGADDDAIKAAKRKAMAAQTALSGRTSTILSGAQGGVIDKLGG